HIKFLESILFGFGLSKLGKRFFKTIDKHLSFLKKHYLAFHVRYDKIRCMPVRNFPYMIHYQVKEKEKKISIKAVFSTYENPDKWEERGE
ncbi:MAG: hypothetical protein V5A51_06100, partial [Bacteroidales bacterium]